MPVAITPVRALQHLSVHQAEMPELRWLTAVANWGKSASGTRRPGACGLLLADSGRWL